MIYPFTNNFSKQFKRFAFALIFLFLFIETNAQVQKNSGLKIITTTQAGAFPLVHDNVAAQIITDSKDDKVVAIAANMFASDVELVTGNKPTLVNEVRNSVGYIILAGTIGHSAYIDKLIEQKKLNVDAIKNKWESFIITTINAPTNGINQAVVIVGSNSRGTAYGLLELSKLVGVSPWVWWADAMPKQEKNLFITPGILTAGEPTVKYRGIFLNDEDWGLQPWAAKTFEPETGDIGPKTYAKIFELLLRLKANLIWPAMHPSTKAFFHYPGNVIIAADYGIIIGSSHAEPMLRNNVGEWDEKTMGHFNYLTNKDVVYKYWEDRVKESANINGMYTLGMRGVHDSGIEGVKDPKDAVPLVERIFKDEREMLSKYVNKDVTAVPQVFTAYKEVLDIYDLGLKVPADATLVWPDDNYGYISRLNGEEEKSRIGGSGVYYHASYWGRPHDYLWLGSMHPSLMREEMMKAYENGSNRLWVVNVGDLKPLEYNIQEFLDMAYDATSFKDPHYTKQHLLQWAESIFGKEKAAHIQPLLWEYYQLAFERKPEFMGWSQTEPTTKTSYTAFNHFFYGDEAQHRIDRYQVLQNQVGNLRSQITPKDEAAFYELVYYPIVGASLMNKKFLYRDKAFLYAKQGRASAADYNLWSQAAYDSIISETNYFNNKLASGKWKNIMSMKPRDLPVYQAPVLSTISLENSEGWDIAPEGFISNDSTPLKMGEELALPAFDALNKQSYFIDIFLTGEKTVVWKATVSDPRIKLSQTIGQLLFTSGQKDKRIVVTIDWDKNKAPFTGQVILSGDDNKQYSIKIIGNNLQLPPAKGYQSFIENNGYVSINAANYSKLQKGSGDWTILPDQGYVGNALQSGSVQLKDSSQLKDTNWICKNASYINYDFYTFSTSTATAKISTLPTHPLNKSYGMRYAVLIDNGPLQIANFRTVGRSEEWKQNVLSNRAEKNVNLGNLAKGAHTLRIYAVDPGVILQKILIDLGGLKKAYGTVPETKLSN